MLQITNNLDRTDEESISNWPFTFESTLDTGNGVLTGDSFLTVSINVDETVALPCRFKGISQDGRLVVCDASGAEVCSGQLYGSTRRQRVGVRVMPDTWTSLFLYNAYGVLSGFVTCKSDAALQLFALSQYANGMHYFSTNAFILLPQCHVQSAQGNVRSFGINGTYTTANLRIKCTDPAEEGATMVAAHNIIPEGHEVTQETGSSGVVSYGVFNSITDPTETENKWCRITVNGQTYNVEDKNLIIKASITSNLRVVFTDAAIILRGVTDA